jgi:hypothetical protein
MVTGIVASEGAVKHGVGGKEASVAVPLSERISALVGVLENEAIERVTKRDTVEKRWIEDIRQYHGKYDEKLTRELTDAKKSSIFINETRPKTQALEARLSDMLFPTDDKNWGIQPTPVPELTVGAELAATTAADIKLKAIADPENQQLAQQALAAEAEAARFQAILDEAKKRSQAMEQEIFDMLKECKYEIQAREVIRDACKLGTGIMKGPVIGGKGRRSWQKKKEEQPGPDGKPVMVETNVYELTTVNDTQPKYWRVDPWHFFPETDAINMEENESVFERHLMNSKELRKLARDPNFDKDAIRELLKTSPTQKVPSYIADLRSITAAYNDTMADRYTVWEYHGPLTATQVSDLATATGDNELMDILGLGKDKDPDPLQELNIVMWFCQGQVLKFGIHPLDSGDQIYSVFNLEKDEASIFGFGLPYIMRDGQKTLCASWRIMLDNAGLSSGPQIVINKDVIEPADGQWVMTPRKIWYKKAGAIAGEKPFEMFNIDMHQPELANMVEMSRKNIDSETNMPLIAQGEQGSHITKTAQGMSILMNAVNVVFRRIVKNYDDDMTTPNLTRAYDFNMQFSKKDHIKGDFSVDARGTSVLLVKEMQSANLLTFLTAFTGHPILGKYLKQEGVPGLRRLAQTMMIPADELIKSDQDIKEDEVKAAKMPPPPNPEMEKLAVQLNIEQMRLKQGMEIAYINRDTEMMKLAHSSNMTIEQINADLQKVRMTLDSGERKFAAEAALEQRNIETGVAKPSGGSLSVGPGGASNAAASN